ncbi:MAG: NAD+ synthase [Magnetovibrio sp.]|nr:NAD+ synthase [Magnetovibrio sp.]
MSNDIKIAIAQINTSVGSIKSNIDKIVAARAKAALANADLVIFGELTVAGYPPEDLVLKPAFQHAVEVAVAGLAEKTADGGPALLIGSPWCLEGHLYNAALLLDRGMISAVRTKNQLPNYGVFDEKRVFTKGPLAGPIAFRGLRLGVMICEDMWCGDVAECLDESGAEIFVVINGSPFETDKQDDRLNYAIARVTESNLPLIYVNLVGGQDELVFDGSSFVLNPDRSLSLKALAFEEELLMTQWRRSPDGWICDTGQIADEMETLDSVYRALVLGVRDYVNKNEFPGILIGLSGGIDSALTTAIAVDAVGSERVHCVMMPSPYTSQASLYDASECCRLLNVKLESIDIRPAMIAFEKMLGSYFKDQAVDVTEENIQARIRGMLLMALSNKFRYMVLSTGNKSEMSVGYATLYGDMCGGYAALKDVYKSTVFELSLQRNKKRPPGCLGPDGNVFPHRIITKPPSAELKPDQIDQDTLPPYEVLDEILYRMIEQDMVKDDIVTEGFDSAIVERIWHMLNGAEYKRRQAPPGVKTTRRAFGRDRRYPIINGFKGEM